MEDFITRLRRAMDYIEAHLEEEVDWERAARYTLSSGYQFARVFSAITGLSLSDYLRMRRLTQAALDLAERGEKVLDVAIKYGYGSPTAFNRAFTAFHGVAPSMARKPGVTLRLYPALSFHMTIEGGSSMQYRIEKKPTLRFLGFGEDVSMLNGENFRRIPELWSEMTEQRWAALKAVANDQFGAGCFGVMTEGSAPNTMRYTIAVTSDQAPGEGMTEVTVPDHQYAVFPTPMSNIQENTRRIYAQWLPASEYEHADAPELEYYPDADMSDETRYIVETWVPIERKG